MTRIPRPSAHVRQAIWHGWIRPEDGAALGVRLSEAMQIAEQNRPVRHQKVALIHTSLDS